MDQKLIIAAFVAIAAVLAVLLLLMQKPSGHEPGGGTDIANPASAYCKEQGGRLEIVNRPQGQERYCYIRGRFCEAEGYFRSSGANCTTLQQIMHAECSMAPDPGPCEAYMPRYFFSRERSRCEQFIWGGCGGAVPFETLKDCVSKCTPEMLVRGGSGTILEYNKTTNASCGKPYYMKTGGPSYVVETSQVGDLVEYVGKRVYYDGAETGYLSEGCPYTLYLFSVSPQARRSDTPLDNPATDYCAQQEGILEVRDNVWLHPVYCCIGGRACEDWAYFRSNGTECVEPAYHVEGYPQTFLPLPESEMIALEREFAVLNAGQICGHVNSFGWIGSTAGCMGLGKLRWGDFVETAKEDVVRFSKFTGVTDKSALVVDSVSGDFSDKVVFKNQVYNGIEVEGTDIAAFAGPDGIKRIDNHWYPHITVPDPRITEPEARASLVGWNVTFGRSGGIGTYTFTEDDLQTEGRLMILPLYMTTYKYRDPVWTEMGMDKIELRLAWKIPVKSGPWTVYVDAVTGEVLRAQANFVD